ncbi:MAG: hypothetical protein WBG86_11420 [Polyangiales bacterium]
MAIRVALLAWLLLLTTSCHKSGSEVGRGHGRRPTVCITEEALEVRKEPGFLDAYTHCTTGSRAVGRPATIACIEKRTGLSEECASCYSWYKACVLRNCFNQCNTTRPEPHCLLCRRNACRGMFLQCSGTNDVFPGHRN